MGAPDHDRHCIHLQGEEGQTHRTGWGEKKQALGDKLGAPLLAQMVKNRLATQAQNATAILSSPACNLQQDLKLVGPELHCLDSVC